MNIIAALGGKKFLLALLGVFATVLSAKFGLDQTQVLTVGTIIVSAILGQSASEAATGGATSSNAPDPIEQGRVNIVLAENQVKVLEHTKDAAVANANAAKSNAVTAAIENGHFKPEDKVAEVVADLK